MIMITEKDRVNTWVTKYGLSENEAKRIVKEDNMVLTVNELSMKFDNPSLGKEYPEWLDPIDHYKMCCATVRQMYNSNFAMICTPEELASTLYINSSIKLNTFENHKHLKTGLITMAMTICRDGMRRQKYWSDQSLDTVYNDDIGAVNYDRIVAKDNEREARECLNAVLSIKNREVREILICAGYIVGGIDGFAQEFKHIVHTSDLINIEKLNQLLDDIKKDDEVGRDKLDNKANKTRRLKLSLKSILNIFRTDLDLNTARLEIGEYLMSTGFMLPIKR